MTCPICGNKTKVVESYSDTETVFRKRKCVKCNYCFWTEENETNRKIQSRSAYNKMKGLK